MKRYDYKLFVEEDIDINSPFALQQPLPFQTCREHFF